MKSSSSRLKFFSILLGLFLVLYLSRHFIFAAAAQKLFSHITLEKFEFKKRVWEEGSLIYEDVVLGDELHTARLRLTPELTFFPLHLALEVYFTQPHFKLSSQAQPPLNLALFAPTKWTSFKLDIEHGTLSVDNEPLGFIDLVSGPVESRAPTILGTLILSEEEGSPYCTCEMSYQENDLYYNLKCDAAPALHLHSFMNLFTFSLPFQLQGGRLDADLKGTLSSVQGTLSGSDLQFATSHGEFDFHFFKLKGRWNDTVSLEGQFEGGRFANETIVIDEATAQISLDPEKAPALMMLMMKGRMAFGEVQGPFTCEAEGDATLEGKLHFLGLAVPFSISHDGALSSMHAELNNIPLSLLNEIAPFEEGLGSAQVSAFFEEWKLKTIELNDLNLTLVKIKEFSCNSIQGTAVLHRGPFGKIEGEFSAAAAPLVIFGVEAPAQMEGFFQLEDTYLTYQGGLTAFSDKISLRGAIDLKAQTWNSLFDSSSIRLSNYSTLFPEGSLELHGKADSKELEVSCIGTDLVFQTETELLQIPGSTAPLSLKWPLQDKSPNAQIIVPPSTLHLKIVSSPIYIEGGNLTWKEGALNISQLQACVEDIAFQGDVAYRHFPRPHLQLIGRSLKGSLHDLSIFDKRIQGWEGRFVCGEGEFLLDGELGGAPPQIHFKAHVDHFSHTLAPYIKPSEGDVELTGQGDRYSFSLEIPREKISFAGEVAKGIKGEAVTFHRAQLGQSKITEPAHATLQNGMWQLQGSASVVLESLAAYITLPIVPMNGVAQVSGTISQDRASVDLDSSGITIGELTLPALKGHVEREHNQLRVNQFSVGDAQLTGLAVFENSAWLFPEWTVLWKEFNLQGSARLEQNMCSLKTEGTWKEAALQGEISWDIKNKQGSKGRLTFEQDALKIILAANDLRYQEGKLEVSHVQATVNHPLLKESIIAPLALSWTPERVIFQGPFSQGMYENDLFQLKGREIHALYENGVLHYQTKLHFNDAPLQAKGYFSKDGRGALKLFEGGHELQITFAAFSEISNIEGKLFGIDCSLMKKGTLYEGKLKIETSDPLAALLQKPEWKQIENLEFAGLMASDSFKGTVSGHDAALQGYHLNHIQAAVDYRPTQFEIRQLKIDDAAGQLAIKECRGVRSHPLKAWEVIIPHLRGQFIQPSLLRKSDAPAIAPKPFQLRQLTLTNVTGIIGRPLTFRGLGSLYFTQQEKRDPSLFDLPRAFLKEWGLDLALLTPARGSAVIELAQGKIVINSLKETFSDGDHSEFYLAHDEPSYVDFSGGLFLNLRMKQSTGLKLAEPFTISVRGTWEKPLYTLR